MAGIGRLQNKITVDLEKKEERAPQESPPQISKEKIQKPLEKTPSESPNPPHIPLKHIPRIDLNLPPETSAKAPSQKVSPPKNENPAERKAEAKDKLYQEILAESLKERLERQKFINQVAGKAENKENPSLSRGATAHQVVFQPVPQAPSQLQKILVRILIVLLIASLGLLAYLMLRGYLI